MTISVRHSFSLQYFEDLLCDPSSLSNRPLWFGWHFPSWWLNVRSKHCRAVTANWILYHRLFKLFTCHVRNPLEVFSWVHSHRIQLLGWTVGSTSVTDDQPRSTEIPHTTWLPSDSGQRMRPTGSNPDNLVSLSLYTNRQHRTLKEENLSML